jgi:hypothetical protein
MRYSCSSATRTKLIAHVCRPGQHRIDFLRQRFEAHIDARRHACSEVVESPVDWPRSVGLPPESAVDRFEPQIDRVELSSPTPIETREAPIHRLFQRRDRSRPSSAKTDAVVAPPVSLDSPAGVRVPA